jgi:hypothetical protein
MRYFFHIVDKYGISPDRAGSEHADQDAALVHAERIAAELAKTGEFFGPSLVLVGRPALPGIDVQALEHSHVLRRDRPAGSRHADFLLPLPTENP